MKNGKMDQRAVDLTGRRLGIWTALRPIDRPVGGEKGQWWLCKCDCPVPCEEPRVGTRLLAGRAGKCRRCKSLFKKSSGSMSPTYNSWRGMIERCKNSRHVSYHRYGGRGITVCKRWESFVNFYEDMGERPAKMSLDRINGNGIYEPSNCRWADANTQASNRQDALTDEQVSALITLKSHGASSFLLADLLKCNRTRIDKIVSRAALGSRTRRRSPAKMRMEKEREDG